MSGHVFHPGHDDLHGITVVLEGASGKTYVGRWHEQTSKGVVMHDVATHDPAAGQTREDFLARTLKFGVKPEQKMVVVSEELLSVKKLAEI
ncbi:MAG TPA: hypothetical protein VF454_00465 [Gemmatimonadales bacterium]